MFFCLNFILTNQKMKRKEFKDRHIGFNEEETKIMLQKTMAKGLMHHIN